MGSIVGKKKKVSDMVIDEIKRMLENGELKEGDKLPNQYEFADQLGVSRPSLREALNQLTVAGVIEQKPGAGTILKVGDPNLWYGIQNAPVLSDTKATMELLEARKEIEPIAIRLAVEKMNNQDLDLLKESIVNMEQYYAEGDITSYLKEDLTFHYLIAKSCHNRFILQMLINIKVLMEEFMRESFEKIGPLLRNSLDHHHAILNAITENNKEKSVFELKNHIDDIELAIINYYKEKNLL